MDNIPQQHSREYSILVKSCNYAKYIFVVIKVDLYRDVLSKLCPYSILICDCLVLEENGTRLRREKHVNITPKLNLFPVIRSEKVCFADISDSNSEKKYELLKTKNPNAALDNLFDLLVQRFDSPNDLHRRSTHAKESNVCLEALDGSLVVTRAQT